MPPFSETVARLGRPDEAAAGATAAHLDRLTKPRGSLGRLEAVAVQLAGIAGESPPPVPEPGVVAVFAGDHGVLSGQCLCVVLHAWLHLQHQLRARQVPFQLFLSAQILFGPGDLSEPLLGRFMQRPCGIGQVRPRNGT